MVAAAALVAGTACNDDTVEPPVVAPTTTDLVERTGVGLADVDPADLRMGAEFNRDFLVMQFRVFGLDDTEASCATDRASEGRADFGDLAVRELTVSPSSGGFDPSVLLSCMSTERVTELASAAGERRLDPEVAPLVRDTLVRLAAAGYEQGGLAPEEADCLAGQVMRGRTDDDLLQLLVSTGTGPSDRPDDDAVRTCLTPERIEQLGG